MVSVRSPRTLRTIPFLIVVWLLALPVYAKYSGGTGEPNDPYQIATAADLILLGDSPGDYDKHFILTADVDLDPNLSGRKLFDKAVIAPDTSPEKGQLGGPAFTGVFDGNGHVISHLTIKGDSYLGLFGQLELAAEVKNLGVVDVNVVGSAGCVGGLVGSNGTSAILSGNVTNCYSTGAVTGTGWYVGGLVGYNGDGDVTQCHSTATVSGDDCIGGLVGCNRGRTTSSYATGTVRGRVQVGGLVGRNWDWCQNMFCPCFEHPRPGMILNSYSTATVSGIGSVGGLVGDNYEGSVTQCYSAGAVSGNEYVGGLAGDGACWGLVGGVVTGCFWDIQTSGQPKSAGGTGKSTAEMQDNQTYRDAGWDFLGGFEDGTSEIWQMPQGSGYPVLAMLNGYAPPRLYGKGTLEEPYLISDAQELGAMIHHSTSAHYRLVAAIDLSGIRWGTAVIPSFSGTFDGNNLTISHLTVRGESHLGLFGQLGRYDQGKPAAKVKNLGVVDVNIIGSGASCGGLVGNNYDGTVTRCYSTGKVTGGWDVGGLVGCNGYGHVTHCYSSGAVNGTWDVAGLVGINGGAVTQCYSTGVVSGGGAGNVGGLMGVNIDGGVANCFWDIQTSGQTTGGGGAEGKTTAEMQTASTFLDAGWDFVGETANGTADLWKIAEGLDYPRLWWEPYDGRVTVVLGQVFTVTLESNPSTGYRWEWVDHQDSIVEQMGEAQFKPRETGDPPLVGAGGWESFDFKAVSQGQMTLKLVYRRPWEEGVEPLKTFSLQVTVP